MGRKSHRILERESTSKTVCTARKYQLGGYAGESTTQRDIDIHRLRVAPALSSPLTILTHAIVLFVRDKRSQSDNRAS